MTNKNYKKPRTKRGPYKIKKIAKNKKEIEFENEFDKIGYQEQLNASQKILKCFKENMIENFAKRIVRSIIIKDIQDIIDKLEIRKKNISKYEMPFNPNMDIEPVWYRFSFSTVNQFSFSTTHSSIK